jgi:hypothetical protein
MMHLEVLQIDHCTDAGKCVVARESHQLIYAEAPLLLDFRKPILLKNWKIRKYVK